MITSNTSSLSVNAVLVAVVFFALRVVNVLLFSARQHMCYGALYAIARPSVCPSHGWISQRRLKSGSRSLHQRVAP